jgi:hypothetical protein
MEHRTQIMKPLMKKKKNGILFYEKFQRQWTNETLRKPEASHAASNSRFIRRFVYLREKGKAIPVTGHGGP